MAESEAETRLALTFAERDGDLKNLLVAKQNLACVLLRRGDYSGGLRYKNEYFEGCGYKLAYNARWPEWAGQDVSRKSVFIVPHGGLGDIIQFSRFALTLRARGARPTIFCPKPLIRLLSDSMGPEVRIHPVRDSLPFRGDLWTEPESLAWRLGVKTPADVPGKPYLFAKDAWRGALPEGLKVGLKVAGNPLHWNDWNRSVPAEVVTANAPRGVSFVSLDPEATGAKDFADTASLIASLDLVVSVDTSVAHLAGAMGKPVWVVLQAYNTDWRWGTERTDSPWYPSARLYRQSAPGDWRSVSEAIGRGLFALKAARSA